MPHGELVPLTRHHPSTGIEDGNDGASKTINFIARQWASPSVKEPEYQQKKKISREENAVQIEKNKSLARPCLPLQTTAPGLCLDLDLFLEQLKSHMFSISGMAFQDAWNLDLERVRDCCIHVLSPDGRLIPFCMYNLTNTMGKSLYRKNKN